MLEAERCIRLRGDTSRRWAVGVLAVSLAIGFMRTADASSLKVTREAALEGDYGLRVTVDGKQPTDTWVFIGPDKGLLNDTDLELSFLINPSDLAASGQGRQSGAGLRKRHLCILGLTQDLETPHGLLVFLESAHGEGLWAVGALVWDDALGNYVVAGSTLFWDDAVDTEAVRLDVHWGAGQGNGYVSISRTDASGTTPLIDRTDLNNGSQAVNYMQVGVIQKTHAHRPIRGDFDVDAFELSRARGSSTPQSPTLRRRASGSSPEP